jgi:uncharacterized membrane protein
VTSTEVVELVLRWMHILAATAAVGGTLFARVAFLPAVETLPEDQRRAVHEAARKRWSVVVMIAIAFLLASGFVNFLFFKIKEPDLPKPGYHALFGIKFLVALAVFFLASALTGRGDAYAKIRARRKLWLTVTLGLAILVVFLSNLLRALPRTPPDESTESSAAVTIYRSA